jgi:regulatory protein
MAANDPETPPPLILTARDKALDLLSRSEQCGFLLHQKLIRRGYPEAEVAAALEELETAGLLSDARFAAAWLRERSIHKPSGPLLLKAKLSEKGIPRPVAVEALGAFFADTPEEDECRRALEKHRRTRLPSDPEDYLQRLGFSGRVIRGALEG